MELSALEPGRAFGSLQSSERSIVGSTYTFAKRWMANNGNINMKPRTTALITFISALLERFLRVGLLRGVRPEPQSKWRLGFGAPSATSAIIFLVIAS
jgi:hypothetical protein